MSIGLHVKSETAKTITLAWTPQPDCGYRFGVDGIVKSNTWDETVSSARFAKPPGTHTYTVEVVKIVDGEKLVHP